MLHQLENSKNIHQVQEGREGSGSRVITEIGNSAGNSYKGRGSVTFFDFGEESKKLFKNTQNVPNSDFTTAVHEMSHQFDEDNNNVADDQYPNTASDPSEIRAVYTENRGRDIEKLPKRKTYGGNKIDMKKLNNPPNYILPKQENNEK